MPRVQVSRRSGSSYVPPQHLIRLRDGGDDGDHDSDSGDDDGDDDSGDDDDNDDGDKGKKKKKNGKGRGKDGKQEGQTAPPQPSPPAPGVGSIPSPSQGIPPPGASQGAPPVVLPPDPKEAYVPPSPSQASTAAAPAGGAEAGQTSPGDSAPPSTATSTSRSEEPAASSAAASPAGVAVNVEPSPIPSSSTDPASSATSTEAASATAASTADASSPPPSGSGAAPTDSASKAVSTCTTATSSSGPFVKREKGGGSKNKWQKGEYEENPCGNSISDRSTTSAVQGQSSQSPQPELPAPSKHNLVIVGVASALLSFTVVSAIIWGLWFLVRRRRKQRRAYEAAQDAARFAIVDPAALPASMYAGRSSPSAVYLPEGRSTPGAGLNVIYGRVTPNSFESGSVPQFITAQEADALHAREAAANPNPFVSNDDRDMDATYVNPFAHPHDRVRKFTSDSHDAESMYTMSV